MQAEKTKNPSEIPRPSVRVGDIIFRVNPVDPGIEKSISELNRLIWGPKAGAYFFVIPLRSPSRKRLFFIT
jgi:hypothetical protein